jgi:hypothetical protein
MPRPVDLAVLCISRSNIARSFLDSARIYRPSDIRRVGRLLVVLGPAIIRPIIATKLVLLCMPTRDRDNCVLPHENLYLGIKLLFETFF